MKVSLSDSIHNPFFGTEVETLGGPGSGPHPHSSGTLDPVRADRIKGPEFQKTHNKLTKQGYKPVKSKSTSYKTRYVHPVTGNKVVVWHKTGAAVKLP